MGEIANGAIMPITQELWEQTYAAWGKDGVDRINALMQPAAELVASSPGCDRLVSLDFSGSRSLPPDNIVFYAQAENGSRFYITEDDVLNKRKVASQDDKSKWLSDEQLVEISQEAVKARLNFPCSFTGSSVYRAMVGRTVVTVEFSVSNDTGASIANVARCYFDGLSLKEVEFGQR